MFTALSSYLNRLKEMPLKSCQSLLMQELSVHCFDGGKEEEEEEGGEEKK